MKSDQKISDGLAMGCFAVACLVFMAYWLIWRSNKNADLSVKRPAAVFLQVFKIPLPVSVDSMKVVGEDNKMAGNVWIRLHVTNIDMFLKDLKHTPLKLTGPNYAIPNDDFNIKSNTKNYIALGWGDTKNIVKPECYGFAQVYYSGWGGTIIVDRPRKLIFVAGTIY